MTTPPQRTEVLIVGAGPAGLAAALALHQQGCRDMVVVDSILAGENTSRALVVHAATLDALDEIGCAKPLIAAGIKASGLKLWDGERLHTGLADFSILADHTKFPFILIVPQHVTEQVLGQRVKEEGIIVHRPFKVVEINANHVDASLTDVIFEDGRVVQTRYLIGADGAHSIVRQCAGIGYADPDGEKVNNENIAQAVIGDVTFSSPPPISRSEVFFVTNNDNFFLCVPVPSSAYEGAEVWRIATGVRNGVPPHAPPKEYLQGLIDAYGPSRIPASALPDHGPLTIEKVIWSTRFRTHSAVSERCFTRLSGGTGGVVILIGDAAHLHPPAGGQGMNLGLRDAVSLGPVLTEHIKQGQHTGARDARLRQWADNRHAQALKVIGLAKRMLAWAGMKNEISFYYGIIPVNWFRIRNLILWLGDVTGYIGRKMPWALSGLLNR